MIQEVYKPSTIEEILELLETKDNRSLLCGGTDLIVNIRNKKIERNILIDISDVEELKKLTIEEEIIKIGAGVTFNQIIKSEIINKNLYGIKKAANSIGSPQIRSRATIGGNIINNSPSGDILPPLLALDAKVNIQSKNKSRKVLLSEFLLDKNIVDIKKNELLTYIEIKKLKENQILGFSKLGFRNALSISKISSAVYIELENNKFKDIKIALGAVANTAIRAYEVESFLKDKEVSKVNINEALDKIQVIVSDSLKGRESETFKSYAIKGIVENIIQDCIKEI